MKFVELLDTRNALMGLVLLNALYENLHDSVQHLSFQPVLVYLPTRLYIKSILKQGLTFQPWTTRLLSHTKVPAYEHGTKGHLFIFISSSTKPFFFITEAPNLAIGP